MSMYRADSIDTSIDAADSLHNVSELQQIVYNAIFEFGADGCISDDVRDSLPTFNYQTITPRYRALIDKGLVVRTSERRKGKSGRNQSVMVAAVWNLI